MLQLCVRVRVLYAATLLAGSGTLEPAYLVEIQVTEQAMGGIYGMLPGDEAMFP